MHGSFGKSVPLFANTPRNIKRTAIMPKANVPVVQKMEAIDSASETAVRIIRKKLTGADETMTGARIPPAVSTATM
jgi:hypothetical protein